MNYKKIYDDFINSRRNRELEKGRYYEKHHIIPVGLGGSNEPDNLIYLTAREHLFAHVVLTRIYPDNNSVKYAIIAMCGFLNVGERNLDLKFLKTISTRFISKLREEALHSEVTEETRLKQRISKLGEKNPMFGKKHKESSKQLMSKKTSGENHWMYGKHWTPEYRENMKRVKEQKGYSPRIFSEEHKKHISESRKGKFTGENNSFFGKTHTKEMKKHLSELAFNRPKKKVIDKDGDILSITECRMKYGVTDSTVRYWANRSHNNKIYWYNNGEKI